MTNKVHIDVIIDIQHGFTRRPDQLSEAEGGTLYVPEGEQTALVVKKMLDQSFGGIFVFSQDAHPADHISFMTNHPGIMAWRQQRLGPDALQQDLLDPMQLPFDDIAIDEDNKIIGVYKDQDTIVAVDTENNRITRVIEDQELTISPYLRQTLWRPHCTQMTPSVEFDDGIEFDRHHNARRNYMFTLAKGTNPECDSHGLVFENDRKTQTKASLLFEYLALQLSDRDVDAVELNVGGLATNICVEYSVQQIHEYIVPIFAKYGIKANINLITDMCRGIPIELEGGAAPSLSTSLQRMQDMGTKLVTSDEILADRNANRPKRKFDLHPMPS